MALCASNDGQKLGGQHWGDITNPEFLRKGLDIDITPLGNQWEYFFDASGRSNHHHAERRPGKIAPGMGDVLAEGDSRTRWGVKGLVAARDACRDRRRETRTDDRDTQLTPNGCQTEIGIPIHPT